jgi:hypothetical protein
MKKNTANSHQQYFKIIKILYKQALQLLTANSKEVERIVRKSKEFSKQPKSMLSIYVHNNNKKSYR